MTGGTKPRTWVGGRLENGVWTWTDGSPWAVITPDPWAPGQPDNDGGEDEEDSLSINFGEIEHWNDYPGGADTTVLPRICQYDPRDN